MLHGEHGRFIRLHEVFLVLSVRWATVSITRFSTAGHSGLESGTTDSPLQKHYVVPRAGRSGAGDAPCFYGRFAALVEI